MIFAGSIAFKGRAICTGIAIAVSEVSAQFAEALPKRLHDRDGLKELQFHFWEQPTVLPVQWEGELRLLRWGSKDRRSRLPYGPWVSEEQVAGGLLAHVGAEQAVIPANMGFDRGTWFLIEQGVCGVVVPNAPGGPVVYVLTRPSTNYYRNMAGKCETMPVLIDQVI